MLLTSDGISLGPVPGSAFGSLGNIGVSISEDAFSNVNSLLFDGVDECVTIPNDASIASGIVNNLTVSFWIKGTAQGAGQRGLVCHHDAGASQRKWLIFTGNFPADENKIRVIASSSGTGNTKDFLSSVDIIDGAWNNIVIVFDTAAALNSQIRIYKNGVEDTGLTRSANADLTAFHNSTAGLTTACFLSSGTEVNFRTGNIDEVSIWDSSFSAADVTALYNSGVPTNLLTHAQSANLQMWHRMGDGDTFPTVTDNSTNTNNGTMLNMESGDIVADVP